MRIRQSPNGKNLHKMKSKTLIEYKKLIEKRLDRILPPSDKEPKILHKAMRYSVFSGGKRLRPIIVLAMSKIFGIKEEKVMPAACGIELIHNFSLIHDDLPSLDNDNFRRGRLTCHKKFGEPVAILAGDALLTLGFEIIADSKNPGLIKSVAEAIGSEGMAGGQTIDIRYKNKKIPERMKNLIDEKKTGKLFQICFTTPFFFCRTDRNTRQKTIRIARDFGTAFQIRDDIEDKEGNSENLRNRLRTIYKRMKQEIEYFGEKGEILSEIIEKLYNH